MNDLISRQAAIDVINAVFPVDSMKSEYAQGITCGAALAKTYVEQLPSAQPQWIPVTVGLPVEKQNENTHDFEYVLCTTTFGDVRPYKFGCQMGTEKPHFWHGAGNMDDYVIAWMPLPEPYAERREDVGKSCAD